MEEPETPLFVLELRLSKKDLVTALLSRHMDFETPGGMNALRRVHEEFEEFRTAAGLPRKRMIVSYMDRDLDPESAPESDRGPNRLFRGHASFHAHEPHEVLSLEEAGELLQVGTEDIEAIAEAGKLPGRKIGGSWRFSRAALLAWLRNDPV